MKSTEKLLSSARGGFTLVELLLVIVILGMLATVAVLNVGQHAKTSAVGATRASIATIQEACELYEIATVGRKPTSIDDLLKPVGAGGQPLLKGGSRPKDAWGNDFQYEKLGKKRFKLTSSGPDEEFGTEDDLSNIDTDKKK